MRIAKDDIPARIDVPGAKARVAPGFGDASGYKTFGGEYFSVAAGTDLAPLLQGLKDDACQSPHWGYMIGGEVVVTYRDGRSETCSASDLFYWPPGHSVKVLKDADVVLFSPQQEHGEAIDHMLRKMTGG